MKTRVIYVSPELSSFVKKDLDILSEEFEVLHHDLQWKKKKLYPINFIRQLGFLIRRMSKKSAFVVMFGGYWALIPVILGKIYGIPVFIILGGTDCVSFPLLNYGSLRKSLLRRVIRFCYKHADTLLPVDDSLVYSEYVYSKDYTYRFQGYKYFFPDIDTKYKVIPNGFDTNFFQAQPGRKIEGSFISVAPISSNMRLKLKGVDIVFKLAEQFPECVFTIVGFSKDMLRITDSAPKNIKRISFLPQDQFLDLMRESRFYLQLSVSEGFPNALCEGMACSCVPIGSVVGAIPKIIKDTGFLIKSNQIDAVLSDIEGILQVSPAKLDQLGQRARQRIASEFPLVRRKQELIEVILEQLER